MRARANVIRVCFTIFDISRKKEELTKIFSVRIAALYLYLRLFLFHPFRWSMWRFFSFPHLPIDWEFPVYVCNALFVFVFFFFFPLFFPFSLSLSRYLSLARSLTLRLCRSLPFIPSRTPFARSFSQIERFDCWFLASHNEPFNLFNAFFRLRSQFKLFNFGWIKQFAHAIIFDTIVCRSTIVCGINRCEYFSQTMY